MDTTNSNESQKRRLADHQPGETIAWDKPGAPAVPAVPRSVPLRAVASMCVKPGDISFCATPAAKLLEPGHYMLSVQGAHLYAAAAPLPRPTATSGDAPADLQQLKALALTETDISAIWEAMPGQPGGFLKSFGYWQFAKAVESAVVARIEREREVAASWQRTAEKKDRDWNEARMAFENYKCAQRAASPATASGDELPEPITWIDPRSKTVYPSLKSVEKYAEPGTTIEPLFTGAQLRAAVSAATKPTADLSKLTPERIDAIMAEAFPRTKPTPAFREFAKLIAREVSAHPVATSEGELPPMLTMKEAFEAVGGWYSGGDTGYPSFGSADALWCYTVKMQRNAVERACATAKSVLLDLSGLTRYSMWSNGAAHGCDPFPNGRWVEFADVQSLLATKPAAPTLPGCLADRLYEAISIARDRAQHAGSTPRMKKWDATAADLRAALAAPMASADAVIHAQADAIQGFVQAMKDCGVATDPAFFTTADKIISAIRAKAGVRTKAADAQGAE